MQASRPLHSLSALPLDAALLPPLSIPHSSSSRPVLPRTLFLPLPSPGRTYGTHFAGDIEEPPVRPPSSMAPPALPRLAVPPSLAAPLAWQLGRLSEPRTQLGSRPPRRRGIPCFSREGRPKWRPRAPSRPAASKAKQSRGRGRGRGAGSVSGPLPARACRTGLPGSE